MMKSKINVQDWTNKQNPQFIQQIIDDHYVLLNSIANRYSKYGKTHNKQDLIAEGSIGLIKAIKTFEPSKNIKFSTYAYFWIKNKILSFINSQNNVKASAYDKSSRIVYGTDLSNIHINNKSFQKSINIDEANLEESYLHAFDVFICGIRDLDRKILLERMNNNITLAELAEKLNVSRETVRQTEIRQIRNFKFFLKNVMKIEDIGGFILFAILNFL